MKNPAKLSCSKFYQGYYKAKNPEKYIGENPEKIEYRSSWEHTLCVRFDLSDRVVKWASEFIVVPYTSPKDNKVHRYFTDFIVVTKTPNGLDTLLIEVKPYAQTIPPTMKQGKPKRRFNQECLTYAVNQAKWESAKKLANAKGWKFQVITEREIMKKS